MKQNLVQCIKLHFQPKEEQKKSESVVQLIRNKF